MIAISKKPAQHSNNSNHEHDREFLKLLPAIQRHAQFALRNFRAEQREEGLYEAIGYAFCAFRRLVDLGKHELAYASPLARFGVARFRAGRRVGTKLNSSDALAVANRWDLDSTTFRSDWLDMLADDSLTPIADQVAFRLEFPAWLRLLNRRDRKLAEFLVLGNMASEAAERFKISRARVSQVRSALKESWHAFQGEAS